MNTVTAACAPPPPRHSLQPFCSVSAARWASESSPLPASRVQAQSSSGEAASRRPLPGITMCCTASNPQPSFYHGSMEGRCHGRPCACALHHITHCSHLVLPHACSKRWGDELSKLHHTALLGVLECCVRYIPVMRCGAGQPCLCSTTAQRHYLSCAGTRSQWTCSRLSPLTRRLPPPPPPSLWWESRVGEDVRHSCRHCRARHTRSLSHSLLFSLTHSHSLSLSRARWPFLSHSLTLSLPHAWPSPPAWLAALANMFSTWRDRERTSV